MNPAIANLETSTTEEEPKKSAKVTQLKPQKGFKGTKADFIRKFPNATAAEIVKKGALAGVLISNAYVYVLRGHDKKARAKKSAKAKVSKVMKKAATVAPGMHNEAQFRKFVADIGLIRATEILEDVRRIFQGK